MVRFTEDEDALRREIRQFGSTENSKKPNSILVEVRYEVEAMQSSPEWNQDDKLELLCEAYGTWLDWLEMSMTPIERYGYIEVAHAEKVLEKMYNLATYAADGEEAA